MFKHVFLLKIDSNCMCAVDCLFFVLSVYLLPSIAVQYLHCVLFFCYTFECEIKIRITKCWCVIYSMREERYLNDVIPGE